MQARPGFDVGAIPVQPMPIMANRSWELESGFVSHREHALVGETEMFGDRVRVPSGGPPLEIAGGTGPAFDVVSSP